MSVTTQVSFFKTAAQTHLTNACNALESQYTLSDQPYSEFDYYLTGIISPTAFALKTMCGLGRIAKASLLLVPALFANPLTNIPDMVVGIAAEATALIINAVNAIAALLLLMTRPFLSLILDSNMQTRAVDKQLYQSTYSMP